MDATRVALDIAQQNLQAAGNANPCATVLVEGEMMEYLDNGEEGGFDLILASLVLHHLDPPGKQQAFAQIHRFFLRTPNYERAHHAHILTC